MYVPARDVSIKNTHANLASKQGNRQARKQASDHPSEAKRARAKLMYNTKCYHAQCGYRSQHN